MFALTRLYLEAMLVKEHTERKKSRLDKLHVRPRNARELTVEKIRPPFSKDRKDKKHRLKKEAVAFMRKKQSRACSI